MHTYSFFLLYCRTFMDMNEANFVAICKFLLPHSAPRKQVRLQFTPQAIGFLSMDRKISHFRKYILCASGQTAWSVGGFFVCFLTAFVWKWVTSTNKTSIHPFSIPNTNKSSHSHKLCFHYSLDRDGFEPQCLSLTWERNISFFQPPDRPCCPASASLIWVLSGLYHLLQHAQHLALQLQRNKSAMPTRVPRQVAFFPPAGPSSFKDK